MTKCPPRSDAFFLPAAETRWYREIDGVRYETDGEELFLPEDAAGETKIDKLGNLLGGGSALQAPFTTSGLNDARPSQVASSKVQLLQVPYALTLTKDTFYLLRPHVPPATATPCTTSAGIRSWSKSPSRRARRRYSLPTKYYLRIYGAVL